MNSLEKSTTVDSARSVSPDIIGAETLRRIYRMRRLNDWMWSRIDPWVGRRVLEAGCGNGTMTEYLLDRELIVCVDINPIHLKKLAERYSGHTNLTVQQFDLADPRLAECARHRIDTVVCLNVLEHIEPHERVLDSFFRLLQPGGRLALLVPAHPALFGTLDVALGHVRRYTKEELVALLGRSGFSIEHHSYLNLFGLVGWWVNGKLLRRQILPETQLDLYERLVPLFAWMERMTRYSLGLSHVIVGCKPSS